MSSACERLIGPKDKRVLLLSNLKRKAAKEPLTVGSLITPGFGGRIYFPTGKGFITLQVMPKAQP